MSEHDDFCEAEYVNGAGGYTSCSCDYRRTRGLVAEHDRQVAERAWDEGQKAGLLRADFEYGAIGYQHVKGNPYTKGPPHHD